jgi:hypothetical protein
VDGESERNQSAGGAGLGAEKSPAAKGTGGATLPDVKGPEARLHDGGARG